MQGALIEQAGRFVVQAGPVTIDVDAPIRNLIELALDGERAIHRDEVAALRAQLARYGQILAIVQPEFGGPSA